VGLDEARPSRPLLLTGDAQFHGGRASLGSSVVYLLNEADGTTAAYGVPWNRTWHRGDVRKGALVRLDRAVLRNVVERNEKLSVLP